MGSALGNRESRSTVALVFTQNAKAISAAQQSATQRSVKAQVRDTTAPMQHQIETLPYQIETPADSLLLVIP